MRVRLALICLVLAASAVPAGAGAAAAVPAAPARVAGGHLVDSSGRWLFLRGVAVTGLIAYASDYEENPPFTPADAREIAALGFDYVRLPVSWSRLEPSPGGFDRGYLRSVADAVAALRRAGVGAVVDLHTDRYSAALAPHDEADGAPGWATVTFPGLSPQACVAAYGAAACQAAAWQSFWSDVAVGNQGLQEHYAAALIALSRSLRTAPNVLGLELMNNPSPGVIGSPGFEDGELRVFWTRTVRALRAAGERRPLWIDRPSGSEETGRLAGSLAPLPAGGQLVYAPHDYAGVFQSPPWPAGGLPSLAGWYTRALADGRSLAMPVVVGEYGTGNGTGSDRWLQDQLALQDADRVGGAFWMWKQRPGFYDWPVVRVDGTLRTDSMRAQELAEPHPDAVPGTLESLSYSVGGALSLRVRGRGGTAVLWSGTQVLRGGRSLLRRPLTRVLVDGRPVPVSLTARRFYTSGVSLLGYVVRARVPAGAHAVRLVDGH